LHGMVVPTHAPALQWSPLVQALPSLQVFAFAFVNTHPTSALQESLVQGLLSLQTSAGPPVQTFEAQTSFVVHLFPSSQGCVFAVCAHPPWAEQVSSVQGLPSSQFVAPVDTHAPAVQWSPLVQASLSLQALAFALVNTQPVAGAQVSFVQALLSLQTVAAPPVQVPAPLHLSLVVQAFPSSQAAVLFVWMQPLPAEQVSVVHTLPSSQLVAAPPLQEPVASHLSLVVQASPSLQF
jgi:hypothetical protein